MLKVEDLLNGWFPLFFVCEVTLVFLQNKVRCRKRTRPHTMREQQSQTVSRSEPACVPLGCGFKVSRSESKRKGVDMEDHTWRQRGQKDSGAFQLVGTFMCVYMYSIAGRRCILMIENKE